MTQVFAHIAQLMLSGGAMKHHQRDATELRNALYRVAKLVQQNLACFAIQCIQHGKCLVNLLHTHNADARALLWKTDWTVPFTDHNEPVPTPKKLRRRRFSHTVRQNVKMCGHFWRKKHTCWLCDSLPKEQSYIPFGRLYKHAAVSYTMDTELFSGVKLPGRGVNSQPPSSAELPLFFLCALTTSYRVNLHLQAFWLYISVVMARENIVLCS
jgi:hypothetical protein